jgi:hypothetical protein
MAGAVLIPRNAAFESLCAVAGAAHNSDARLNPASTLDWECCRGFETQPTPDVLALALGEHQDFNGSASVPDALRS